MLPGYPGPDSVSNELLTHCGKSDRTGCFLLFFVNACLVNNLIPETWRRAKAIAILKPGNPSSSSRVTVQYHFYAPHSNFLKGLSRINLIIDPVLPTQQAVFWKSRSTVDKVCRWIQNIERAFHDRQVFDSIFLDLKAAYDTVWYNRLKKQ